MARVDSSNFRVLSWNIQGIGKKMVAIESLMKEYTIICLQEHMLDSDHINILKVSSSFNVHSVAATRSSDVGRPRGGIATFIRTDIKSEVVFQTECILAVQVGDFVIINVYLPTNYRNVISERKYAMACAKLGSFIYSLRLKYLICGDFNCDLKSQDDSLGALLLNSIPPNSELLLKDKMFTHVHPSGSVSDIDHILVSSDVICSQRVNVLDMPGSDHLPLVLQFVFCSNLPDCGTFSNGKWKSVVDWRKADVLQYCAILDSHLDVVRVPYHLLIRNYQIEVSSIRDDLDLYYGSIVSALKRAETSAVPRRSVRVGTELREWSNNVALQRACFDAKFWFRIWNDCGRPRSGVLNDLRLSTKKKFKKELSNHLAILALKSSTNDLWKSRISPVEPEHESNISENSWYNYFHNQFCKPHQNISSQFLQLYRESINTLTDHIGFTISCSMVRSGILRLKKSFSCGVDCITTFHLLRGSEKLISHLAILFTIILNTGIVPSEFSVGIITPIPKKGKRGNDCDSFRPITVAPTICKLFECIIFDHVVEKCTVPDNQLGFQRGIGCEHALSIVAGVINMASSNNETLFLCSLDVSRAFDSVVHSHLLYALLERGVHFDIVRALSDMYAHLRGRVKFKKDCFTSDFPIFKGVRQGSKLSPTIFNNALIDLQSVISPTYILNGTDLSIISYADDVLLISRSFEGLMRNIKRLVDKYADYDLYFNTKKTEFLIYNNRYNKSFEFTFPGTDVRIVNGLKLRYLGINLGSDRFSVAKFIISYVETGIRISYAKICRNRVRMSRRCLTKLFNAVAIPHVLYISPFWHLLKKNSKNKVRIIYFRFAKLLLRLRLRSSNSWIMRTFGIADPYIAIEKRLSKYKLRLDELPSSWKSVF